MFVDEDGNPDLATIEFVRQLIGYGLTGHTSEQAFYVLNGAGSNGKSQFVNVIMDVFSAVAQATAFSTFAAQSASSSSIPSDLASMKGARIVVAQ